MDPNFLRTLDPTSVMAVAVCAAIMVLALISKVIHILLKLAIVAAMAAIIYYFLVQEGLAPTLPMFQPQGEP